MNTTDVYTQLGEALDWLRPRIAHVAQPEVAIVLGSGLGSMAQRIENATAISFADIPHFGRSSALLHAGTLVFGTLQDTPVVCMQGRIHLYEGFSPAEVAFPVCVMNAIGARTVIFTNASGGIRPDLQPGDVVAVTDHINFTGAVPFTLHSFPLTNASLTEAAPATSGAVQEFHPHAEMTGAYTPALIARAHAAAQRCDIALKEGVYIGTHGPQMETPAEIRAFRAWGADIVGMSTVLEAIAARSLGMDILCLSHVVNHAAGLSGTPISGAEVAAVIQQTSYKIEAIICELLSSH